MSEYVYIQNYNKQGIMGISYAVFDQIAEIATNEVSGATVSKNAVIHASLCAVQFGTEWLG